MEDELDRMLRAPLVAPPPDFAAGVVELAARAPKPERAQPWRSAAQWLTLAVAGIPALIQLLAFMLGMWAATTAG
jgi:hypothetical protein